MCSSSKLHILIIFYDYVIFFCLDVEHEEDVQLPLRTHSEVDGGMTIVANTEPMHFPENENTYISYFSYDFLVFLSV